MSHDPAQLVMASFTTSPEPTVILTSDLSIAYGNEAWRDLTARNDFDPGTNAFHPRLFGAPEHIAPEIIEALRTAINAPHRHDIAALEWTVNRARRIVARPMMVDGAAFLIVSCHGDRTGCQTTSPPAEQSIQNSLWAAVVRSTEDAILTYDLDGRVTTWNRAAQRLYEYTAEEMIGVSLERLYPPDWPTKIATYRDRILAGELVNFEAVRVTKSGEERTVAITGAPVLDSGGQVIAISNIHRDVTERRKEEETRAIKAREAVHRAKNLMAVIMAIQRQIARTSQTVPEVTDKFVARISSLSKSIDLLVRDDYAKIAMADVVRSQLDLFESKASSAITMSGPDILLEPQATQTLGMVLFELLTNAVKHGALSAAGGKVSFHWDIVTTADGRALRVTWAEEDGPEVSPPERRGFGSTVLTRLAATSLNAEAHMDFCKSGVRWTLSFGDDYFSE